MLPDEVLLDIAEDKVAILERRITTLEGHRLQWRNHAMAYLDALEELAEAASYILSQPVRDPILLPLRLRNDLQDARNRAIRVIENMGASPSESSARESGG